MITKIKEKAAGEIKSWYLDIIGCPHCKAALVWQGGALHCRHCNLNYAVENGIPALLEPGLKMELLLGQNPVKKFYYAEEHYDWTSDPRGLEYAYHRYRKREVGNQIDSILKPDDIVLDLGCGTGLITRRFIGQKHKVLAIDLNRWALSRMDGKPWVTKIQADGESLPIQDESIDLAIITEMIEHLECPQNAVSEVFRVCKKGARVIGSVPSTSRVWKWRQYLSLTCGGGEPFHHNYTKKEITDLWQKAGFKMNTIQISCIGLNWLWILEKP